MNSVTLPSEKNMIARWIKENERRSHQETQKQKILNALSDGYDTLEEISTHTGIAYSTARRILLDLERQKKVSSERVKRRSNRPDRIFIITES